jgi:hypothetical protein
MSKYELGSVIKFGGRAIIKNMPNSVGLPIAYVSLPQGRDEIEVRRAKRDQFAQYVCDCLNHMEPMWGDNAKPGGK